MTPTTGGVKGEVIDYGVNCAGRCMLYFFRKPVSDLLSFVCIGSDLKKENYCMVN